MIDRREAIRVMGLVAGASLVSACFPENEEFVPPSIEPVLKSRPGTPSLTGDKGKSTFTVLDSSAVIYVPLSVDRATPTRLILFLHGANRTVDFFVEAHRAAADESGAIILAPFACCGTWDGIQSAFGPDIAIIDAALKWTFDRWTINPAAVIMSGFSDGATYSLAVGRANGDFFSRVVAYSPGFLLPIEPRGKPPILVTHGIQDNILPIDATSRNLVPVLRNNGYTVDYREFTGGHAVLQSAMVEVVKGA
jgi:phospholipase/carboxylesterase